MMSYRVQVKVDRVRAPKNQNQKNQNQKKVQAKILSQILNLVDNKYRDY